MKPLPPLTDSIAFGLARLVDDAQKDRRDPSHSDIEFCINRCDLAKGDPIAQGQVVGKAKRVRGVLSWAVQYSMGNGQMFVAQLVAMIQSSGGFRAESPNYVGENAIQALCSALKVEGYILSSDGELHPASLDALSGTELTDALTSYARRAQRGAEDAALVIGTGKDLLEAAAAHVLRELWNVENPPHSFPAILGQAFAGLELKTSADKPVSGEPPQHRMQRALYEAACSINTLRNREGTGHGRPWLPSISPEDARHATQVMGVVADLLLRSLKQKNPS